MTAGEFVRETQQTFLRWIKKTLRRPPFLFFALVQPIVWFVLFAQSFSSIANIPGFAAMTGTSSYVTFFSTAVIIQTIISSAMQSGMGMVQDMESGFLDRMRVAPIHRSSILLGKILSDAFRIVIQTLIIFGIAVLFGVTVATGVPGFLLLVLIAALFGIAWSGISNVIALGTKNSESTMMISIITSFPLLFLSTAMLPKPLLPEWVQAVAVYNPLTYIADALHGLIITGWDWTIVGYAFLTILVVGGLSLTSATRMFRRIVTA
ncbi:MAG TPA: ABC transporter permease [Thermoplasmata archaeon]|nr:ABC transporter permease [Thermoplasmata archaeon]